MFGSLASVIWHANYYDGEKSSDSFHAIRMLRCQSSQAWSYIVDPHTPIVPCGRESKDYVILTKMFCSNILRMVV